MTRALVDTDGTLDWTTVELPALGGNDVRIRVRAAGVNRADLIQRAGHYPPPRGASPILGLECAGEIIEAGPDSAWAPGDRVAALLTGGGYAEEVVCDSGLCLPLPDRLSFAEGAALPEVLCTAHDNLFAQGELKPGERVLIHAGGSGVGAAAVQLCRAMGHPCFVTLGNAEKLEQAMALGASAGAIRHEGPWWEHSWLEAGVDVALCPVGAAYLGANLRVLRPLGRLVVIGLLGGRTADLDLGRLLVKRLTVRGSVLRGRTLPDRRAVVQAVRTEVWPRVAAGEIRPILHRDFPASEADQAHALLASNRTFGTLVLTFG